MASKQRTRPWYCSDQAVEEYKTVHRGGTDLKMLKSLKIIRSIIVNLGIIAIALYALKTGGDSTIIAPIALFVLGGYNGVEYADYMALAQAISEISSESGPELRDSPDDDN